MAVDPKEPRILKAAYGLFVRFGYRKVTMSDIAEAAELSRPSLYAVFANKEAVFGALVTSHIDEMEAETRKRLDAERKFKSRIETVFDVWIVQPVASLIESEAANDLRTNSSDYAPAAVAALYERFEALLLEVLKPEMKDKRHVPARDLAHILMLAAKGLKASTGNVRELRRMIDRLVTMTLVLTEKA